MKQIILKLLQLIGIRTHRKFRLLLRGLALAFGLCAAFKVNVLLEQNKFDIALYVFFIVLAASFLEFILADVLANNSFPFNTERKLALMEKQIGRDIIKTIAQRIEKTISEFNGCDTKKICACVHILTEITPTSDGRYREGLLQLTDYVGPHDGKKGRITLITQGIIGRCARTHNLETVNFADSSEYFDSMVKDFGFTKSEAEKHTKTALIFPQKAGQ